MKRPFSITLVLLLLSYLLSAPLHADAAGSELHYVPLFTLNDHNGEEISLEAYRGKVVMINFWATWCPPCIEEMPTMQGLKTFLAEQPFEILAVNMGEEENTVKEFIKRTNIEFNFPLLIDPTTAVATAYEVSGLPATLLVDKQGIFAFGGVGPRDWNSEEARKQILELLQ